MVKFIAQLSSGLLRISHTPKTLVYKEKLLTIMTNTPRFLQIFGPLYHDATYFGCKLSFFLKNGPILKSVAAISGNTNVTHAMST